MTFEELSELLYDDLNGFITRIETLSDGSYSLRLECDECFGSDSRRYFEIVFDDVIESECDIGFCSEVSRHIDHVLTWDHNAPHESVYFSEAPNNAFEILGRIYESHIRVFCGWRTMQVYWTADTAVLAGGHGLLFRSPTPLADIYCSSLDGFIPYSRVRTHRPQGGYVAFLFDNQFVIAKAAYVTETNSEQGGGGNSAVLRASP